MSFKEYYEFYLTLHQHPKCRLLHFIGQVATLMFTIFVLYGWHWYLIPFIPFVVYPFAWAGHYVFEKNTPAAFSKPVYAKMADMVMFRDILLRRLSIW